MRTAGSQTSGPACLHQPDAGVGGTEDGWMAGSPHLGCSPVSPQSLNLTTGREKWSSDSPRSIIRSAQWKSSGGGSGKASGMRWVEGNRKREVSLLDP